VLASAQKTPQTPEKNGNFRKIGEYALALFRRFFGNWCFSGAFVTQLHALTCRISLMWRGIQIMLIKKLH